jgi:glycosyltransferase involved in cell wall biosynthesis
MTPFGDSPPSNAPPASVDTLTILHVRPHDPTRTAIAEYASHFGLALSRVAPFVEVVDLPTPDVTERMDTPADHEAVIAAVRQQAEPYRKAAEARTVLIHVEVGNALHREFWAGVELHAQLPRARIFCTVHDPPTLCSNPYRYVDTERSGRTRLVPLNKLLTRMAESKVVRQRAELERRFVRSCAGLIALKRGGATTMDRDPLFAGVKVHVLPHIFPIEAMGLRPPEPEPESDGTVRKGELLVTLFGFLGPNKGIEEFIEAFELTAPRLRSHPQAPALRLRIFGGVPPAPWTKEYIERLHWRINTSPLAAAMEFRPGFVSDAERDRQLAEADILVHPFLPVGRVVFSSASLIRAMALGKAIVATQTGTIPEEIVDGRNGLLYHSGDARGLGLSLERLALDPALRFRLRRAAFDHAATEHSESAVAKRLAVIYGFGSGG